MATYMHAYIHTFGPIEDIMQVLYFQKKGANLNNMERLDNQLNDEHTNFPNIIFDTILKTSLPPPITNYTLLPFSRFSTFTLRTS